MVLCANMMNNDIKKQLDFLRSNQCYTESDLFDLVYRNNLCIYFCHILKINTLGLKETEKNIYVVTTRNKNVICIGRKPDEIDYLYNRLEYFINPNRKEEFKTIGKLSIAYFLQKMA